MSAARTVFSGVAGASALAAALAGAPAAAWAAEMEVLQTLTVTGGLEVSTSATATPFLFASSSTNKGNLGVGSTTPSDRLSVGGTLRLADGSEAAGKILVSDAQGTGLWQLRGIPSGAVSFFELETCPDGWSALAGSDGRYSVGLQPGGLLAGGPGTSLTDKENRAVGQHAHAVNDPGHSHDALNIILGGPDRGAGTTTERLGPTALAVTGISVNNAGAVADTNAPYVQLQLCQKD